MRTPRPQVRPLGRSTEPFLAPDGLRFERSSRSWQPYVGVPRAVRHRRLLGDAVLVAWAGSLLGAMAYALIAHHF